DLSWDSVVKLNQTRNAIHTTLNVNPRTRTRQTPGMNSMQTRPLIPNRLKFAAALLSGLIMTGVHAGDVTFNFDSGGNPTSGDPALDATFMIFGNHISTDWAADGGSTLHGQGTAGNGFVELVNSLNGQALCIVFPDIDGGLPIKA